MKAKKYAYFYTLQLDYGSGYEDTTSEDTLKECRQRQKEYRLNQPEYPSRIVRQRELIENYSVKE